jgi:NADPH2:quinone reductase
MHAAYINEPGSPDALRYGQLPTPTPAPSEVLVKVAASAVNPIDTYIRGGVVKMAQKFPYIPGCDLAGAVEAIGAKVTRFKKGDRVWGSNQGLFGRQGALAEYAAVDECWLYPTPPGESDELAAAGALVGITAHLGLFLHGGLKPGEIVFVNGGTGGVGSAVVQFAKAAGARVIATAGSEEKLRMCKDLGADLALNYRSPTIDESIRGFTQENGGVDLWWETQREPTFDRTVPLMKKRGRIVLMAGRDARPQFPVGPFYVNDLRLVGFAMFNASPDEQRKAAEDMNKWFTTKKWKPLVGKTFALKDAAAAHKLQEENTLGKAGTLTGKIVVTTSS